MIEIVPLYHRPNAIEQLARWHFAQWGAWNPANDVAARTARFREHHLQAERVPQTFVAVDGKRILGSASLIGDDLDTHNHLTPWVASVYVDATARRQGIGSQLVLRVVDLARNLGFPEVYLFTPDQERLYASLGFRTIEHAAWGGTPVVVMSYNLRR